ncbi:MAG: DUF2194 domain-containing protein [Spirochaetia bacterium]|nr:DUF2194 domain-containing protein [Spirochaetia bacterium]
MNRFRYALVIVIILLTAVILQSIKVIDIVPEFFWIDSLRGEAAPAETRLVSADPEQLPQEYQRYFILHCDQHEHENNTYYHLMQVFRNAHVPYQPISTTSPTLTQQLLEIPQGATLIIAQEITRELSDEQLEIITAFVAEGGHLSILTRSFDKRLETLGGFVLRGEFIDTCGIVFEQPIFPGLDRIERDPSTCTISVLDLERSAETRLLLSSSEGIPLLWEHPYQKGMVLFSNSTLFQDKINRGLLLQYLLDQNDYGMATIFNRKIFNIDDFPAPVPLSTDPELFREYQRSTDKFYREIWWSDIRDLSVRYDLLLTGLAIGTYNNDTQAPMMPISEIDLKTIEYFGRKLNEVKGELGIHGYNHNPMLLAGEADFEAYGYAPWPAVDDMVEALDYLIDTLERRLGAVSYHTYVAPSNLASLATKQALMKAIPSIRVLAGIYTGGKKEPGAFIQEFGPDPDLPGVYNFPRFSSGYMYTPQTMWNIYSAIAELGVFNHFIHPDDILDPERSLGNSWEDMSKDLSKIVAEVSGTFPFLEPATDYDAYTAYRAYEQLELFSRREGATIEIWLKDAQLPVMGYLRVDEPVTDTDGVTLMPLKRDGLYVMEITKPYATVTLLL